MAGDQTWAQRKVNLELVKGRTLAKNYHPPGYMPGSIPKEVIDKIAKPKLRSFNPGTPYPPRSSQYLAQQHSL